MAEVVNPGGHIALHINRVGGDITCRVAVGGEADHVVCIIISKERRLRCRSPFGHLAAADIVAVVGGVTHGIRYRSGLVAAGAVRRGSHIAGGISHADAAPGDIRHGRGGIAATIGVRQFHARSRVAARGGGHDAGKILLRNRKSIHRHRLSGDG